MKLLEFFDTLDKKYNDDCFKTPAILLKNYLDACEKLIEITPYNKCCKFYLENLNSEVAEPEINEWFQKLFKYKYDIIGNFHYDLLYEDVNKNLSNLQDIISAISKDITMYQDAYDCVIRYKGNNQFIDDIIDYLTWCNNLPLVKFNNMLCDCFGKMSKFCQEHNVKSVQELFD